MFNKIAQKLKKSEEKILEERMIRLDSIIAEVGGVLERRGVNAYELMDVIHNLQGKCNMHVANVLQENHKLLTKDSELKEV